MSFRLVSSILLSLINQKIMKTKKSKEWNLEQERAFKLGRNEAVEEEILYLKSLLDNYFQICIGEDGENTPRNDILMRMRTLILERNNENKYN